MAVAVRKMDPSRALARMSAAKKYPKFVHQNELVALNEKEDWEVVSDTDHDVAVVDENPGRAREEKSEVRLMAAPSADAKSSIAPMPAAPSATPMHFMTNSAFEQLLASAPPPAPVLEPLVSVPPPLPETMMRSSARPTVRLGPQAVMVISPPDVAAQRFAASPDPATQRFASLLSRPNEALACALPRPVPLLPTVTQPTKSRWGAAVTVAAAVVVAGVALFGAAHYVKGAYRKGEAPKAVAVAAAAPPIEAERTLELPATEPAPSMPAAAKKAPPTGPSQARAALAAGDIDSASTLFEELADNPSTRMDGLVGLAEVSRARGDLAGARARYRDILTESPQYFPAKLGVADTTWDLGEKDAARRQYASLETSYPSRMIPPRAHDRAKRR